jgi:hypothetical protein
MTTVEPTVTPISEVSVTTSEAPVKVTEALLHVAEATVAVSVPKPRTEKQKLALERAREIRSTNATMRKLDLVKQVEPESEEEEDVVPPPPPKKRKPARRVIVTEMSSASDSEHSDVEIVLPKKRVQPQLTRQQRAYDLAVDKMFLFH